MVASPAWFPRIWKARSIHLPCHATVWSDSITQVRTRQLKFLGHILLKPEDEPANLYALYFPTHGRRKPGQQSTSYLQYIQHLLGDDDGQLTSKQIANLANNRKGWRKLTMMMIIIILIILIPEDWKGLQFCRQHISLWLSNTSLDIGLVLYRLRKACCVKCT